MARRHRNLPRMQARRMPRENMSTLSAMPRLRAAEQPLSQDRSGSASAMADLFVPLERLLSCGGDPRLNIDPVSGANDYGCQPLPCPGHAELCLEHSDIDFGAG